jgi:hypothetical protein
MFDGTAMLYIANPYFPRCPYEASKDDILQTTKDDSKGFRMKSPRVFLKTHHEGGYNPFFIIAWMDSTPKMFYIVSPMEDEIKNDKLKSKINLKLTIRSSRPDTRLAPEDQCMQLLDYQLSMATEVLLVARLFDINLKALHSTDNKEFLTKIANAITAKVMNAVKSDKTITSKAAIVISQEYAESFEQPPMYKRIGEVWEPVNSDNIQISKPYFQTIMQLVKKLMNETNNKYTLHKSFIKIMRGTASVSTIPAFRLTSFLDKTDEIRVKFEGKATCWFDHKTCRPTQIQTSAKTVVPCTVAECVKLWGGTEQNVTLHKSCMHNGCIFFSPPRIDMKFYARGQPGMEWSIDKISTKRFERRTSSDYTNGSEIFDEDEDYNRAGMVVDRDEEESI